MDSLMLGITVVSVVVAATAAAIAWRVTRAERARSAARVAALAAAAGVEAARAHAVPDAPAAVHPVADAPAELPSTLHEFMPARKLAPHAAAPARDDAVGAPVATGAMFGAPIADSGSGHRQHGLLAAAAVVAVLIGGGSLIMFVSGRAPAATAATAQVPLELVALSHARIDGQLAVSGLVRNPAAGRGVDGLEAHVRVFDAAGIMIATRSAPVDAPAVAAGQDVPFTVTLGEATTAARYRVSFASRGTMLAHVDKRTNLPAAVTAEAR